MADLPTDRFTGLWIAVESGVARDQRVHLLAEELGISDVKAVGHLVLLWGGVAEHEPTGLVGPIPQKTLEVWALWQGKRGRFTDVFKKLFVDENGQIHAWNKHNGRFLAEALRERQRKAAARAAAKSTDQARTVRGQSTVNPTQPNPTQPTTSAEAAEVGDSRGGISDVAAFLQIAEALNAGMRDNPAIVDFRPVKPSVVAGEWVRAGIHPDLIIQTVSRLGREFTPTAKDRQISSLQYCDAAVRAAPSALEEARYEELKAKARRGLDMAKYADWWKYEARYRQEGKAKVTSGSV